jgi:tetratricopeptide (TPR) repeat protein
MLSDPRGLPLTAASAEAVARLEATILAFCGLKEDVGDRLKEALAADPQLVMAHLLRGYFLLLLSKREFLPRAQQAAAAADAAIAANDATPRETRHRQALEAWIARDTTRTIAILSRILADFPRDIVALKLLQFLLFYSGDSARMHATVAAALPAWDESVPAYGFALGCHAFSLEESGDYDAAERAGRRAVALNPEDIWGAHAVAHVFEMQDRVGEGLAWIDTLAPHWRTANNFAFHVWWHRCLYLLALLRFDEVLERYDREVRADSTDDYLDVTNAISLLWRLEQRGVAVGNRWNELAERAAQRRDDHITVFADAHYAMALAASDPDAAAGWSQSARAYATQSRETQAAVMEGVGLALGAAAIAHRRGDFAAALDRLLPLRAAIHRIGGSHAQRDLFAELLIDAAVKAGRHDVARDLLRERLAARPLNAWGRREIGWLANP